MAPTRRRFLQGAAAGGLAARPAAGAEPAKSVTAADLDRILAAPVLKLVGMRENRNIASWLELDGHRVVPALDFVVLLESPAQPLRFQADNRIRPRIKLRAAIEEDAPQHGLLEPICRTIQHTFDGIF